MDESTRGIETILRLTDDGQVTIPKRIRDALDLEQGDYLRVAVEIERRSRSPRDERSLELEDFSDDGFSTDQFDPDRVVRLSEAEQSIASGR